MKAKEQNKETNSEDQLKNIVLKQEEKFSKFLTEFETLSSMNQKTFEFMVEMNKKIVKSDDKMNEIITQMNTNVIKNDDKMNEMLTQISNLNNKSKMAKFYLIFV